MKDVSPRDCGYAIAPHGSLARDLDVIAVPWTEDAVSAETRRHGRGAR